MLLKTPVPDSNEFGFVNTIEKVLDLRDVEVEGEDEDDAFCAVCSRDVTTEGNEIVLCDGPGCANAYHQQCLDPPLRLVPEGEWFCPKCEAATRTGGTALVAASHARAGASELAASAAGARPGRQFTKMTLAALALGLPYDAGVVRHTRESLAELVQMAPDMEDESDVDDVAMGGAALAPAAVNAEEEAVKAEETAPAAAPSGGEGAGEGMAAEEAGAVTRHATPIPATKAAMETLSIIKAEEAEAEEAEAEGKAKAEAERPSRSSSLAALEAEEMRMAAVESQTQAALAVAEAEAKAEAAKVARAAAAEAQARALQAKAEAEAKAAKARGKLAGDFRASILSQVFSGAEVARRDEAALRELINATV
jgi:hypothetical protein